MTAIDYDDDHDDDHDDDNNTIPDPMPLYEVSRPDVSSLNVSIPDVSALRGVHTLNLSRCTGIIDFANILPKM